MCFAPSICLHPRPDCFLGCSYMPPEALINRYRKALDAAVKTATVYNVKPIRGTTLLFCCVDDAMRIPCTSAKGLGKPRQVDF